MEDIPVEPFSIIEKTETRLALQRAMLVQPFMKPMMKVFLPLMLLPMSILVAAFIIFGVITPYSTLGNLFMVITLILVITVLALIIFFVVYYKIHKISVTSIVMDKTFNACTISSWFLNSKEQVGGMRTQQTYALGYMKHLEIAHGSELRGRMIFIFKKLYNNMYVLKFTSPGIDIPVIIYNDTNIENVQALKSLIDEFLADFQGVAGPAGSGPFTPYRGFGGQQR